MEHLKRKEKISVQEMTMVALSAVILAICAWITVPLGAVPFTLQTFGVFLVTAVLGLRLAEYSILLYILLGLVGIPVFSAFRAGPAVLLGATGGYIIGFLFVPVIYTLITQMCGQKLWAEALGLLLGDIVVFVFGTAWFLIVYARTNGAVTLAQALAWCVLPFIIPDVAKLLISLVLARRLRNIILK